MNIKTAQNNISHLMNIQGGLKTRSYAAHSSLRSLWCHKQDNVLGTKSSCEVPGNSKIFQKRWRFVIEGFVCHQKDFEFYFKFHSKRVKRGLHRSNVITLGGSSQYSSSSIFDKLKDFKGVVWSSSKDSTAFVQLRFDECVD